MVDGTPGLSWPTPGRVLTARQPGSPGARYQKGTALGETDPAPVPLDAERLLSAGEPGVEMGSFCAINCKRHVDVMGWLLFLFLFLELSFQSLIPTCCFMSSPELSLYNTHCSDFISRAASPRSDYQKCIDKYMYVYSPFSCPNSAPVKERISLAGWPGHRRAMYHRRDHASITTKSLLLTRPPALPRCHLPSAATAQ